LVQILVIAKWQLTQNYSKMAGLTYRQLQKGDDLLPAAETYKELLMRPEWRHRRIEILDRDKHICTECNMYSTLNYSGAAFTSKLTGRFPNGAPYYQLVQTKILVSLHIHHKYYVLTRSPWEYESNALLCLCQGCHTKEHEKTIVPVFLNEKAKLAEDSPEEYLVCPKCGGSGYLHEFNYHMAGMCFGCNGYCFVRKISPSKDISYIGSIDRFFPDRER
jgi:hypothetical protein